MKNKRFIKYIAVSLVSTIVNIVTYLIFVEKLCIDTIISNSIAWIITVYVTYILNKKIVFNDSNKNKNELLKFYLLRFSSLLIDTIVLYICIKYLHLNNIISKIISNVGTTFNNYFISKYFIFMLPKKQYKESNHE